MKNNKTLATAVVVAVTLMGSTLCHAQTRAEKIKMEFEKIDLDKSGSISLEEFTFASKTPNAAGGQFARIDTDKDGLVLFEEFLAFKNKAPRKQPPAAQ
jgi:Ca2+-binding EF-hand superfamily protein